MNQLVVEGAGEVAWHAIPEPDLGAPMEALVRPPAVARGLRTDRVTSRVAAWEDAPTAVLEVETKLIISREDSQASAV